MNTSDDRIQSLESRMREQSEVLSSSTKTLNEQNYHTNSTFHVLRTKVNKAVSNIPSTIKNAVFTILLPIFAPFAVIAAITFILLIALSCAFKKCKKSISSDNTIRNEFTIPMIQTDQDNSRLDNTTV